MTIKEDIIHATPFIRGTWACQTYPSPERENRIKIHARSDAKLINIEILPTELADFDPDVFWATGSIK